MRKIYYLSTCSTCQRIIKELELEKHNFEFQDIKTVKMTGEQLDQLAKTEGSYEALFSRRAIKFKSMGLKDKKLIEQDYRKLILDEYTFLKRPVIVVDGRTFTGNSAKVVQAAKEAIR